MSNEGANKLGRILQDRVQKLGKKPPIIDFGTIQNDMSLKTDNFPVIIPQNDYMVCRSVAGNYFLFLTTTENDGNHPHGESGEHPHGASGQHPHGESGTHPHGASGKHPHGDSGEHEHTETRSETFPDEEVIIGGEHKHPNTEGEHEHPDTEGAHEHPDTEGKHKHPDTEGKHKHPDTEGSHSHRVKYPDSMIHIKPGDRVLVAWVGDTCTVIDIILPAKIISTYKEQTEE